MNNKDVLFSVEKTKAVLPIIGVVFGIMIVLVLIGVVGNSLCDDSNYDNAYLKSYVATSGIHKGVIAEFVLTGEKGQVLDVVSCNDQQYSDQNWNFPTPIKVYIRTMSGKVKVIRHLEEIKLHKEVPN